MPFAQIAGHGQILSLLKDAVTRRRVPQSLLFAGPEAVGKRTVALALAQAVNCPGQTGGDACGTCNNCRRIAAGTFHDVVVLGKGDKASIGIDPLREKVLDLVGYRPFEGARRVFIIDPADEMTLPAQDALLKTLEEPPPSVMLILITAYAETMRDTIRSRCSRLRFGALGEDDVARVLMTINRKEGRMDAAEARRRAVTAGGSVSRALTAELTEFEEDRAAALGLLTAAQRGSVADRLRASTSFAKVEKKRKAREAGSARLAILASLLRDLAALDAQQGNVVANTDLARQLDAMAASFNSTRLISAFDAVRQAEISLDRNASPKIVADWLAVSM